MQQLYGNSERLISAPCCFIGCLLAQFEGLHLHIWQLLPHLYAPMQCISACTVQLLQAMDTVMITLCIYNVLNFSTTESLAVLVQTVVVKVLGCQCGPHMLLPVAECFAFVLMNMYMMLVCTTNCCRQAATELSAVAHCCPNPRIPHGAAVHHILRRDGDLGPHVDR